MAIKLITGVSGDRHITPEDDAALHRAAVGSGAFFLTVPTFKIVNNNARTMRTAHQWQACKNNYTGNYKNREWRNWKQSNRLHLCKAHKTQADRIC